MNIKNVIEQNPNLIESAINAQSGEELMALLTEKGIQVDLEAASKLKEYINKAKAGELTEEEMEQFQRIADSAQKDELGEDDLDAVSGGVVASLCAIAFVGALYVGALAICYTLNSIGKKRR